MTSESAASPMAVKPAFCRDSSARVMFVTCATGTRASAPADVFQADAVTPTERRVGTMIPSAPKAAADRAIAPRLRGSVTPSSATSRVPVSKRAASA